MIHDMAALERVKLWIPIKSLGWVNIYIDPGAKFMVDAGMLSGRSALELATVLKGKGSSLCGLDGVVITHFHVDHSSMAALLAEAGSPTLYMGWRDLKVVEGGVEVFIRSALQIFMESGLPKGEAEEILSSHPAMRLKYAYDTVRGLNWRPLREGDTLVIGGKRFKVLELPGHTPGHIGLLDEEEGALYSGDVLLQGITPHITLHDWGDDPLGDYLSTLRRIAEMDIRVVYPGHRDPITMPGRRALEILEHHRRRLQEVADLLDRYGPMSGYDVARRVRWRVRYKRWDEYPMAERFFAVGEALAHLRRLEVEGRAERFWRGGVVYWRSVNPPVNGG